MCSAKVSVIERGSCVRQVHSREPQHTRNSDVFATLPLARRAPASSAHCSVPQCTSEQCGGLHARRVRVPHGRLPSTPYEAQTARSARLRRGVPSTAKTAKTAKAATLWYYSYCEISTAGQRCEATRSRDSREPCINGHHGCGKSTRAMHCHGATAGAASIDAAHLQQHAALPVGECGGTIPPRARARTTRSPAVGSRAHRITRGRPHRAISLAAQQ